MLIDSMVIGSRVVEFHDGLDKAGNALVCVNVAEEGLGDIWLPLAYARVAELIGQLQQVMGRRCERCGSAETLSTNGTAETFCQNCEAALDEGPFSCEYCGTEQDVDTIDELSLCTDCWELWSAEHEERILVVGTPPAEPGAGNGTD